MLSEIVARVSSGQAFILIDDHQLGIGALEGRQAIPFTERDGQYWGPPADDRVAIDEFERSRRRGAGFLFVAWPSFWWLENYPDFRNHLDSNFERVVSNDDLVVFNLRT